MENVSIPSDSTGNSNPQVSERACAKDPWCQPLGSLVLKLLKNPAALKGFFSLSGGSILYCLSALSILYGIAQIMTPLLAKSKAFSDALPCIVTLNIYELAMLAVLITIVVWRNVTDDAVSLVVLVALFLITSGIVLGAGAYHAPKTCFYIGLVCAALGLGKLLLMRRFISFQIGKIALLGMTLILLWNFLTSSVMAGFFADAPGKGTAYRNLWLTAWLVLLTGAGLIIAEAAMRKPPSAQQANNRRPMLHTPSMVWIFALIILAAATAHQYGLAYMYRIPHVFGDYVPHIAVASLLAIQLMRSLGKQAVYAEIAVASLPLACTICALLNKSIIAPGRLNLELLWYPPVMLGLIATAILSLSIYHHRRGLLYVVLAYAFGCLLTIGFSPNKPHQLNWFLCGGGIVAALLVFGVVYRNMFLCFTAVILLAGGLAQTEMFAEFAKAQDLTPVGAVAGVAGLGTILICFAFGRKILRVITALGAIFIMVFIFDYLGISLSWKDLPAAAVTVALCVALWLRTRDITATAIITIPMLPKLYLLAKDMSSWAFVALSFLLLFVGAAVSIFCKRKESAQPAPNPQPPGEY